MFWFFGCEARGILDPQLGFKPASPVQEGEVLTIGPPRKSSPTFHVMASSCLGAFFQDVSSPGDLPPPLCLARVCLSCSTRVPLCR